MKKRLKKVYTSYGRSAGESLVIPASLAPGEVFKIGDIRFRNDGDCVIVLDIMPVSWKSKVKI